MITRIVFLVLLVVLYTQVLRPLLTKGPLFPLFRRKEEKQPEEPVQKTLPREREQTVRIDTDEVLGRVRSVEEARDRLKKIDED